jgi:tetratricopeptide (TPR) repeat protein
MPLVAPAGAPPRLLPPGTEHFPRLVAVAVALAIAAAYSAVPSLGFVWDDGLILESRALAGASGLWHAVGSDLYGGSSSGAVASAYWRPVALFSLGVNALFGRGPAPLHVGNVVLHVLVAALLLRLLGRRLPPGAGQIIPAAVTLAWALHPEHVEVVAWISCRYELLVAVASLMLLVVDWKPGVRRAAVHGGIFLLGLLSKEGFPVMAAVVLADDWANRRRFREALPRWIAIGVALIAWAGARSAIGIRSLALSSFVSWTDLPRNYLSSVAIYAGRAVAPLPLSVGHRFAAASVGSLAFAAALAVLLVALAWRVRRLAVPATLVLAPLASVAVASSTLGISAERYFYLPSLGIAWLVAEALVTLTRVAPVRTVSVAILALLALAGASAVHRRVPEWRSDEALFGAALAVDPADPQANLRLGVLAAQSGRYEEAARLLERARSSNPSSGTIASGLAWVYLLHGELPAALSEARRAVALEPASPQARLHLAAALHLASDHTGELAQLDIGVSLAPGYRPVRIARASARCEADPGAGCDAELEEIAGGDDSIGADALARLGEVAIRRGDLAAASRWLERLRSRQADHPGIPELAARLAASPRPR